MNSLIHKVPCKYGALLIHNETGCKLCRIRICFHLTGTLRMALRHTKDIDQKVNCTLLREEEEQTEL